MSAPERDVNAPERDVNALERDVNAPERDTTKAHDATWLVEAERGTVFGIRILVMLCNVFGRGVARFVVRIVAFYFTLAAARARAASRAWLSRALGRPAGFMDVVRHIGTFAVVALDRVFLVQRKRELFELTSHGSENLARLRDERRGAILVGAHLGSFEAMRAQGDGRGYDIHVLAYQENAQKIGSVLTALSPEMAARVINLGGSGALLHAKDVVDRGGIVAILGDRVGLNAREIEVPFLGQPALFPTGPYLLAHALGVPMYFVAGLYRGGNRYELHCEPLFEHVRLPRKGREEALAKLVGAYAEKLERFALSAPYNWFNLYDFWAPKELEKN